MESKLQDAIRSAGALANMADEAENYHKNSELKGELNDKMNFNRKMKTIFDEFYYGGQG